ncbi:hypothetical protein ACT3R5_16090 [Glutamicibacter sp. AOP5-A2-7]
MITAEKIECTQITRPRNFGEEFGNLVTTLSCDFPLDQDQWSGFLSNPNLVIGASAAAGTIGAVFLALWQSKQAKKSAEGARADAIAVAEAADNMALKREVRIKELELYTKLWGLSAKFAASATDNPTNHNQASVDLALEFRSYLTYLSITAPGLVKPLSSAMQMFQTAVSALNEYTHPQMRMVNGKMTDPRFAKQDPDLKAWVEERPNLAHDLVVLTGEILNIMPSYYDNNLTEQQIKESLRNATVETYKSHRPLIDRYRSGD